ncbi:gamma-aminobutyric acid type B receptor subunit 2 isoform X2 [Nasonia vitripennis]|uniref:Gamma-aminobutyric acid type B receptor subunit 2 n=1 Tax=Nasonia vitripennis TaxID=7425 RepID=A0A7M7QI21_NASVI|nr:gamma-aminobutyric acid type B receptor subunit 2 isoform X2 [Nasonia vitripennis]
MAGRALAAILLLDAILSCLGQKPLNLGGIRKRDVYIAGLFPYATHVPESIVGRGVMPSALLAIDHVNENQNILRNYRLHMWWNDTQCNAAVGVKAFFDMMHSGPPKVMIFGSACTQVTDPIAKAAKHWKLTQLSYADTHPMFTADSFPNFFRIVPSENAFNAPRFALLAQFNWTRVGTIYQNEPRYALAHNRLVSDLDLNDIEVVESQSFATEVTTALEKLKTKDVRIILGNFNEVWARIIFCEAHRLKMYGRKYQWVIMGMYTEEWWLRSDTKCAPLELQEALHGTILTDLLPLSTEQQITVSGITPDEYLKQYDARRGTEYSRFHGYSYDGIWAIALAIQNVARKIRYAYPNRTITTLADFVYQDATWEKYFLEALKNTSFEGVTGPVRFYDNERKAYILLKQFQSGSEVKVGEYDAITNTLDLTRGQPLVWRGKSPPKDRTLHIIEHSTVNITIYSVLAATAAIGIVMAAVFLAINIKYRNQRYIKMSSPHLNNLIIIGCMLTYSSVIFLGLDSQLSSVTAFPYICTARAWLLMAGFSLAFGSMFSKTWRVHSIFTDVKLNKKVIKDYQLFMVVGVLLFIDLAIMTTWQVADPFYRETKQMEPYPHPSSEDIIIMPENEYCQSNRMTVYLGSIYAYKGLLMIFGAFLAWETRHVSIPALNDSKYVGMSVYNVVIMCVTGAAISFVLADKQDAMFIMLSVFIIFCSTATLCLVFVPKLIELRRNPQGQIDKRFRPTLRPMSKARRDSTVSELEERLKDVTTANQKFRKQLHEKESELQMYLRRLGDDGVADTQAAMDRLTVPRHETTIKREGPSVTTETTDISMSMCSLNSTTNVSQLEGDYVNVSSLEQQVAKKKTSFSKTIVTTESERPTTTPRDTGAALPSALKHSSDSGSNLRRRARIAVDSEKSNSVDTPTTRLTYARPTSGEYVEESHSNEESETPRESKARSRLPTPPPPKNVSFGELHEQSYLEQAAIVPPPVQFVPKHRHTGSGSVAVPHQSSLKRRSSVKSGDLAHSHHELFEKRRPSVPANSISYISTENVARAEESLGSFDKAYVISECGHKRAFSGGTGYRCEKHGGRGHSHAMLNGSADVKRHRGHHLDSHNASSPSVPNVVNASYSDTEKYEETMSGIIQRSVSERSRDKYTSGGKSGPVRHSHPVSECPHRRRSRECRHVAVESKLRQQASRLEYVQSTPDVATIHNNKFASANPRSAANNNNGSGSASSKMYSAVSDGELLDVAILPIFQKLLTERHKSTSNRYGASVASCPNISIKCDIVEYL